MKFCMKAILVVATLAVLHTPVQSMPIEAGFLDTKWSSPAKDLEGFTRVGGRDKIDYYVHPQRKYTFLGAELPNEVVYGFYEDKFFAAYADIDGIDLFSQIKSYIQKKYGVPTKTSRESRGGLTTYIWRLKQVQVKFKHYEKSGKMKIALYYLPIARQVNAEMQKSLEAEPFGPRSLLNPYRESEYIWPPMEFMSF